MPPRTSPNITTQRLELSRYEPTDEDAFAALFGDPTVSRWVGDGPGPESEDRELFARIATVYAQERFDVWGVRRDGELIGHAEVKPTDVSGGEELIYVLARSAWGAGLGTELARALVAHAFDTLGLTELHATVHEDNAGSMRVLEKLGFVAVGDLRLDEDHVTRLFTLKR